jgi:hypothetical protein
MKRLALAAFLLLPLPGAAQEPSITIAYQNGVPEIQIDQTDTSCPAGGLDNQTRQKIIDAAAGHDVSV